MLRYVVHCPPFGKCLTSTTLCPLFALSVSLSHFIACRACTREREKQLSSLSRSLVLLPWPIAIEATEAVAEAVGQIVP